MDVSIIGHRGAKGMAPENTLAAARLAQAQGADMWELDVGLSRDGVPMVLHDESLMRTSNVAIVPAFVHRHPWLLEQFTLAELRGLDAGAWFDPAFTGEGLPTLQEALALSAQMNFPVNVELKDYACPAASLRAVVRGTLELIARLDMAELVLISSFSKNCLHLVKAGAPHLKLAVLAETGDCHDLRHDCLELGACAAHPDCALVTPQGLTALREANLAVNVWTINSATEARRLAELGATGLITDYPLQCREWLAPSGAQTGVDL